MKVLILDSDTDSCASLMEQLRQAGYTPVAVAAVRQAREVLAREAFDLFVLEWQLPDGRGAELVCEIRERFGGDMVVVFMSTDDTPWNRVVGLQVGADDFVGKQCSTEGLLARIAARQKRRAAPSLR